MANARYFFDDRGSYLHKSLEGLLRSILHRITSFDKRLADIVLSMYATKASTRRDEWPLSDLQQAFMLLLDQEQLPVDFHLFLDALDEYGDPAEIIADFVTDLSSRPPSKFSRVKICFSSRPWNVFLSRFSDYPRLDIHEHTKGDIRHFAYKMIVEHNLIGESQSIEGRLNARNLLSDVCERAEGVFLWVRLVSTDLIKAHIAGASFEKLRQLVLEFPRELEGYYARTVNRIPQSRRFDTFVMLEIVVRSSRLLTIGEFIGVLRCASCETIDQCVAHLSNQASELKLSETAIRRLREDAGGLIEVLFVNGSWVVQLMHQTVKDFISTPGFMHRVLGTEVNAVFENGHSFLAKYYMAQAVMPTEDQDNLTEASLLGISHAQLSESTTGISQAKFFDSLTDDMVQQGYQKSSKSLINSRMSFAAVADLRLYVCEKLTQHNVVNRNPSISLLYCLTKSAARRCYYAEDSRDVPGSTDLSEMCRILLDFGANINDRSEGLTPFESLFSPACQLMPGGNPSSSETRAMVQILLQNGQDPNAVFCCGESIQGRRNCRAIFMSDAEMSDLLLRHGASVNILDGNRRSPLDVALSPDLNYLSGGRIGRVYDRISTLLDHGGGITKHGEDRLKAHCYWLKTKGLYNTESLKPPSISRLEKVARLTPALRKQSAPVQKLPVGRSRRTAAPESTSGRSSSTQSSREATPLPNRRLEIRPRWTSTTNVNSGRNQGDNIQRQSTLLRNNHVDDSSGVQ